MNTYSLEKTGENANIPPSNIYYVVNPSDYAEYNEFAPYNMTHYFYITDIYNPQLVDSWKPILYEYVDYNDQITTDEYAALSENDKNNYTPITEDGEITSYARKYEGDVELYERAKYLDSIISSNIGNNPHVGFGRYDLGGEYRSYMENPFKYYEDNYELPSIQNDIMYRLKYSVTDPALSEYVLVDEDTYNVRPFTNSDYIKFVRVSDTVDLVNINNSGGSTMLTIRFNHGNSSPIRRRTQRRIPAHFETTEAPGFTDINITISGSNNDVIGSIIAAINQAETITYNEYMALPPSLQKAYAIDETRLIEAFSLVNRKDSEDATHDFDLRVLYEQDTYTFGDFKFDITEYETENKVKSISATYHYESGYAKRITQEEFDEITEESERRKYERQIVNLDENGDPVYEYVKNITIDEYNAITDEDEKSDYYQTTAKIFVRGTYRDKEDYANDTAVDYVEKTTYPSYYLNSKLIKLEFKNTNQLFKKYFLDVIGKYVMQVIPSTAITVILFDCDNKTVETEDING